MPPKPLLSGLGWRVAAGFAAVLLAIAILYAISQIVSVLNTGIAFS
jgi:hypothetical protein